MNLARHFGHSYPVPDFGASLKQNMMLQDARRYVSDNRWWFAGGTILGLALITIFVLLLTGQLNGVPERFRR